MTCSPMTAQGDAVYVDSHSSGGEAATMARMVRSTTSTRSVEGHSSQDAAADPASERVAKFDGISSSPLITAPGEICCPGAERQ
jgi:hypothetical protein